MSGLLFLKSNDFHHSTQGNKGKLLVTNIPSFSLVLFYSTKCEHCQELLPIFKSLPGTINNCQFGILNISSPAGKPIIEMAKDSMVPIKFVPFIILYVGGKPFVRYNGPRNRETIQKFVVETAKNIQKRKQEMGKQQGDNTGKRKKKIPDYSLGEPLCGYDDILYLKEEDLIKKVNMIKNRKK